MRKLFAVLALALGIASVAPAQSVAPFFPAKVTPVSSSVTTQDSTPALVIKYFAPQGVANAAGTTTVATAATSLTFVVQGAAYAGFEAPVSGALGGIIDMSDASANTLGEVVDIINSTPTSFSTGYFRAVIAAGLRSDVVSTLAFVADSADTDVSQPGGEIIYWDSSVLDDDDLLLANNQDKLGVQLLPGRDVPKFGPFANTNTVIQYAFSSVTNAGTVGNYTIYGVKERYNSGEGCSSTGCGSGSEEVRVIFVADAVTSGSGTNSTSGVQFLLASGEKVFVRVDSSAADTSARLQSITGYTYPNP